MPYRFTFFKVAILVGIIAPMSWSQTIKGTVSDEKTSEKVPFASVFFNNTSIATETNIEGNYQLKNMPQGIYTLIVRMTGYKPHTQRVTIEKGTNIVLDVKLKEDERLLDEIKIATKRDKTWERQFEVFEKQFLGANAAETTTKIVNPWVLDFTNEKGVLTAKAADVLEINNRKLGYQIRYSLNEFRYDGSQVFFSGYAEFVNLFSNDSRQKTQWETQRQEAYRGSDIHLFKALKNRNALAEGFEFFVDKPGEDPSKRTPYFYQIQSKKLSKVLLDSSVKDLPKNIFQVYLPARIEIHFNHKEGVFSIYKDKACQVAWIESNGQPLRFNEQGIVLNPQACSVSGYLAENRVSSMLPIDYQPISTQPFVPVLQVPLVVQESPFFVTDRPYYYANDLIQLSGSMCYTHPELADSLSSILHLELLNPVTQKIIVHQRLALENGRFAAKIILKDPLISPQTYLLRAYTQWMRNFSDSAYSYCWIPILPRNEHVQSTSHQADSQEMGIEVVGDSLQLKTTQRNLLWGTLSVTNTKEVSEAIISTHLPVQLEGNTNPQKSQFNIEKAIEVKGVVLNYKPHRHANVLLLIPKESLSFFASITDAGHFSFADLPIKGNQTVLLQVLNPKGNPVQEVEIKLDSISSPKWIPRQEIEWQIVDKKNYEIVNFPNDGINLEEVKIKAAIPPKPMSSIYKQADYVLQGKDLFENAVGMNILSALQGRVPGIRIVEFPGEDGLTKLVLTMRAGASAGGFQKGALPQPLVLVDGVPFENINQIAQIPASQVERVEVVNRAEAMTGSRGFTGVISIITKQSGKGSNVLNDSSQKFEKIIIDGLTVENPELKSPLVYYWNASVPIEPFQTSGIRIPKPQKSGKYRLFFEGLTNDNKVVRATKFVEIN